MSNTLVIVAVAIGLLLSGVAVLRYRRRAADCPRHSKPAGAVASLVASLAILAAVGLLGFVLVPAAPSRPVAAQPTPLPRPEIALAAPADPDEPLRLGVVGTWTDRFRGKRTMTLKEDGTGVMLVELEGLSAALFAQRLQFEMAWSVEDGRLKKQTIGGEPTDKVNLILKTMGDRVAERIEELTEDRLVLVDQDGTTRYTWTRVR